MIGSIGLPEFIMIFVVALLVIGPKKLPQFAKFLGKSLRIFKDTINETKRSIKDELDKTEISEDLKNINKDFKEIRNLSITTDDED